MLTTSTCDPFPALDDRVQQAITGLEVLHRQTQYPLAKSCASLLQNLGIAIVQLESDPAGSNTLFLAAKNDLESARQGLNLHNTYRWQPLFKALVETVSSSIDGFSNGDKHRSLSLLIHAADTANTIYRLARMSEVVAPNFADPRQHYMSGPNNLEPHIRFEGEASGIVKRFRNVLDECRRLFS